MPLSHPPSVVTASAMPWLSEAPEISYPCLDSWLSVLCFPWDEGVCYPLPAASDQCGSNCLGSLRNNFSIVPYGDLRGETSPHPHDTRQMTCRSMNGRYVGAYRALQNSPPALSRELDATSGGHRIDVAGLIAYASFCQSSGKPARPFYQLAPPVLHHSQVVALCPQQVVALLRGWVSCPCRHVGSHRLHPASY